MIVFSGSNSAPLYRVPAAGSAKPVEATRLGSGHAAHRYPFFLPDGRRFLFVVTGTPDVQGAYLGSLDSVDSMRLVETETKAVLLPPDVVLFGRNDAFYAQRIDFNVPAPIGEPVVLAEPLARNTRSFASAAISTASTGTFAYRLSAGDVGRELRWVARDGRQQSTAIAIPGLGAELSPDTQTVAVVRTVSGNGDIWLFEIARGVMRRFAFEPGNDATPRWSPDGSRIAFHASRKGGGLNDLFVKSVGETDEQVLLESAENKNLNDWSSDGRFILYTNQSAKTARDIWALPLAGDRKPFVVVQTPFEETLARFSPDGRWIAYASFETGRFEIYVKAFPGPGRNWQISIRGGVDAQWRSDGREIVYVAPDNRLMAVPVTLNASAGTVAAGVPSALFSVRPATNYSVSRDGQRFLLNTPTGDDAVSPITIVLNWKPSAR